MSPTFLQSVSLYTLNTELGHGLLPGNKSQWHDCDNHSINWARKLAGEEKTAAACVCVCVCVGDRKSAKWVAVNGGASRECVSMTRMSRCRSTVGALYKGAWWTRESMSHSSVPTAGTLPDASKLISY